jgi:hypothetical protein
MNATTTQTLPIATRNENAEVSDATRLAQYNILNELPGAIFGVITVAYIFASLLALAH